MPVFEYNGKKYNVKDEHVDRFAESYPEATTITERDGKKYRVKSADYNRFAGVAESSQPPTQPIEVEQTAAQVTESIKSDTIQPAQPIQSPKAKIVDNPDDYFPQLEQNTRNDVARLTEEVDESLTEAKGQSARQYAEQTTEAGKGGFWKSIQNALVNTAGAVSPTDMQVQTQQQVWRGGQDRELAKDIDNLEAAEHALENARRTINEADINAKNGTLVEKAKSTFVGGAARGFGQKLFDVRTWDMGATDLKDQMALNQALDAAENGTLTESQQALLDAKAQEMATQAYFGSYVGRGYKAGSVTAESLPFMLEMCINPASTLGKSAASRLARYAIGKYGKRAAKSVGQKAVRIAGRALGDVAGAATMTATTGSLRTAADAMDRMSGGVVFDTDEQGHTVFAGRYETPEDVGMAIKKAFAATTIENYSEMLGSYFAPMLGVVGKGTRNVLDKITAGRVGQFLDDVAASDFAKAVSAFEKNAQWSGNLGEFAEEIAGGTLNAIVVGDQTLDSNPETGVFNRDNLIDTFLGVTLLGGSLSMLKTAGYGVEKYQLRRDMKRADVAAVDAFGSVDEWDKIKTEVDAASNEELPVLLGNIISNPDVTDDQKTALMVYVGAKQREKGAVIGEQKRRENPDIPQEQVEVEQSYDNGRTLETPQEKNDAQNMYEYQQQQVREFFGLGEDGDTDAYLGDDVTSAVQRVGMGDPRAEQLIVDYFNAKATRDGVIEKAQGDIEDRVVESDAAIDGRTNADNGMVHSVEMNNGKRAYVVKGNIVTTEDGTMVDRQKSDESIVIADAETGKREMTTPANIAKIDQPIDAATEKEVMRDQISNEVAEVVMNEMNGVLPFQPGDTYTLTDDAGVQHSAQIVADNGDGTVAMIYDNEQEPTIATKDMIQEMFDTTNQLRLGQYLQDKQAQEIAFAEQEAQAEQPEVIEKAPQSAMSRIPTNETGEQLFEQAPVQDTWAALVELNEGDTAEAVDTAQQMYNNAKKELEKAQKQKPKVGTSVAEIQANKAEYKAKVSAAQAKADYWSQVANFEAEQKRLQEALVSAQRREQARQAAQALDKKGRYSEELTQLGDYLDFEDYVMRAIVSGGIKFKWSDNPNGTKGLGSHLGLKGVQSEMARRIWLLNNEEGEYPEIAAQRLLTAYNEDMGFEATRMDTMGALDVVLSVLGSYDTPSTLLQAIQDRHNNSQEQYDEVDIQQQQYYANAQAAGMTVDEWLLYEESLKETVYPALETVSDEELNRIFAETYQKQDERSRENAPIQQGVSEREGRVEGNADGNSILPKQQPDNTETSGRGDEQSQRADAAGQQSSGDISSTPVSKARAQLSSEQVDALIASMEANAVVAPTLELSPENWEAEFGANGVVATPIGTVKMGDNQYLKLLQRKRQDYFGMIKPTLTSPDVILEEYDPKEDVERDTKLLFVKTFIKQDGSRYIHFESVTVRKEDREVSISSHEVNASDLKKKMHNDKVVHLNDLLLDSELRLTEPQTNEGSDLVPTPSISESKDTTTEPITQEVEQENLQSTPQNTAEAQRIPTKEEYEKFADEQIGKTYTRTAQTSEGTPHNDTITFTGKEKGGYGVNVDTLAHGKHHITISVEEVSGLVGYPGNWIEVNEQKSYTITPAQYTNKRGKVLDMHLVKFSEDLSKEQQQAAKQFAKENRGWWDKEKGGFMMRSEESAKELADTILNNAEAVSDAQPVSLEQMREVGSATNDVADEQPTSQNDDWRYELTVYENGRTILERSQIMPDGSRIYDGHFEVKADSPREMQGILSNPANGLEGALDQIGTKLNQRADVFDFRAKARTEGVNGFKIGDKIIYTYNGQSEKGTIHDFNDYGDHAPVLDLGTAPIMYVQAQWDQIEKIDNSENVLDKEPQTNPSGNKLVTDERYEELKRKMRQKLMGQMNMGIDPEILAIGTEMAVYHIEKGARKFADYAKDMIADLGDVIRPYLKAFYNGARELPEVEREGFANEMTPYDEVRTFDVANFDKAAPNAMAAAETTVKEQEVEQQAEVATEKIKNNRNKARKSAKKSVTSQQAMGDLFSPAEQSQTTIDDGLQANDDRVRTGGLPADGSESDQLSARERGEVGQRVGQETRGADGGRAERSDGPSGSVSSGLLEPKNINNNHSERGVDHAPSSVDARIEANIKAIELAQTLIENEERATPAQMAILRKFSGWGGLGKAFTESSWGWRKDTPPARLRELLGEEAYEQAIMSANSSYYTPAYVIDTLWDIAEKLGFEGGKILEASAGIGNILGQMPKNISEHSDIQAVEIDKTAGGILSLLYPDAQVEIQGFEQTSIPNGSVDLAITNVPFVTGLRVNDTTSDKDLSRKFHNIHDFCIAKNVRKLREGGLGIFITSNGTLDNSKKLRDWVVNEGNSDFIGAFRLNNKTFAGTSVTSDIIVVRKRVNNQASPNAIDVSTVAGERTAEYDTGETRKIKGVDTPIIKDLAMDYNRYFMEHPERMAGNMQFGFENGETFRPTSKGLYPNANKNQDRLLADFVNSFKEEQSVAPTAVSGVEVAEVAGDRKVGELFVRDGKLHINHTASSEPLAVNNNKVKGHTKVECFEAYDAIKKALNDVLEYQSSNDSDNGLKPLLTKLNKVYDDFVDTYGHFNKNTAIAFLRNDVDYANVSSIETYKEQGDGKGGVMRSFGKADVMTMRVIDKEKEPVPTNIKDGIVASIFKYGRVNVPYIAEQLSQSVEEVKRNIIEGGYGFEDPTTKQVEASYQYLSGNVREKLRQAQDNNESGEYDRNIKALENVIPMNIPAHLIDFTLGSSWVDSNLYNEYVKDRTDIDVTFTAVGGTWFMKAPEWGLNKEKNRAMGVRSEMLHKIVMGHDLIEAAIQNKTITVSQTSKKWDGTTETIVDKDATQACAAKIDEIRQDFKDWAKQKMQSDPELSNKMERIYNDLFNNYVPLRIPAEFVPEHFVGASRKFTMKPHQGRAIVRGTMQPLLLAHEVGTGKTFTLISTAMEMRRLGTARKPMIVVQNATVGQFVASAKELYPNAKILTLEEADRDAAGRKNFYAKIRYNDWDMIVVPQSTFEFIPDSEERQMAFVQDKIEEKMIVLEQMKQVDSNEKSVIARQAKKEIEDLEAQLAELTKAASAKRTANEEKKRAVALQNAEVKAMEMLDRRTDDVENFDDMHIDALLIDEAHEYKHLGFATAMQRGVKGVDPSYSKKSQGVYLKTQAVLENNNGRNVIFATGTPISNTAAEIWTFMRYLMPADTMKEYGIYYFDDFVRNFGNIQQMLEFTTSGKFKENNRFAGYVNLPELVRIWSGVADTVLTEEAEGVNDKIPETEGGKTQDLYLPQTRALRSIMKFVKAELNRYDQMSGKQKKENSHIPLTMYGIAKAAAVDARLVQSDAEDDPNSKTNEAVRQTLRALNDTKEYNGTVAIFADNYQNKYSGFNLYDDIRNKLIAEGVPADQVVVIKSGMSIKKKLEIFEKVNRGEIRVILGSTFTLGTGVNIQERLHTLIHLDAPNRPMDYTQRNGRILRQGNLHKEMEKPVRILRFGVEDSLDVTAYQRLKTKGAIADSIMRGKQMMANSMTNRVLEEEEDVFGDTVAQLSGSEYAMLKNNAEKNVRKFESRKKQWEADQTYIHNAKPMLIGTIKRLKQLAEDNRKYYNAVQSEFKEGEFDAIIAGGTRYQSIDAMADFIKAHNKRVQDEMKKMKDNPYGGSESRQMDISVGSYKFTIYTTLTRESNRAGGQLFTEVHRKMTYSCPELGINHTPVKQALLRNAIEDIVENVITGRDFTETIESAEIGIERSSSELQQLESREGKPFEFEEELQRAKEQLKEYSDLMKKELEEKEAKYAEMDAGIKEANDVLSTEEDTDDGVRYRSDVDEVFDADFAELESEYQQLNKKDEQAMAEWRTKKKRVVEGYLNYMTDEYALPCSVFVFDHNDEQLLQQAFEVYINTLASKSLFWKTLKKFARQWAYDNFKSNFVGISTRGARIKGHKASIYDIGNGEDLNKKEDWLNALLHENTHYVVEMLGISDVDNSKLWEEFAHNGKPATVARYVRNYNTTERRVSELLAYSVGDFIKPERVELFDSFMNGDATVEDILKFYNESLPLRNDYVRTILNELKNGRKVREEINRTSRQRRSQSGRGIVADRISQERDSQKSRFGRISNERDGRSRRDLTTISEAAEELAKQLNIPIHIIGDVSEITDDDLNIRRRKRNYKGWYNVSTGEVVVVAPNATSVADIQRTVIHEVVAHNGLRELFGADFDTFLDNVYQNVDEPIRRAITNLAARKGWNFRVATEEYLASLAETTNFEEIEKQSWWQKIKDYFMDLLRKVGVKLAKPLTNDELRYILWRSYQMQKSKGAMAVAEDVDMQRKLGVGNFRTQQSALHKANEQFNRELQEYIENGAKPNTLFHIGMPQGVLQNFLPNLPIVMRPRILNKASRTKHNVEVSALRNLPSMISEPIFVFNREDGKLGVLTEIKDRDGKNVCIAIEMNKTIQDGKSYLEVNDIITIHGREVLNIIQPIVYNNTLQYVDKKKGLDWLSSASYNYQQEIDSKDLDSATKIVEEFDNTKYRVSKNVPDDRDSKYMDAVERGDMETAQRMVDEAAKAAGYTEKVYHGTPHFGFTTFDTQRSSGVIFTTNKRNVAANYAGDNNYASVRKVNKGYKEPKSINDIIENARSVFNQDWRLVTPTERETVINKVEAEAQRVEQKINSLRTDVPTEIEDNVAWVENIIYSAADGRENGNEGDEMQRMLFDDYEQFEENRNALREWIGEHRPELTAQQQQYLDYLIGYELGDVAIDANFSFANAFGSEELATVDGQSFTPISDLAAITGKAANIGAYELYGNLGHNPLVVNGEGHAWFNLRFNGMRSTDDIANWAKQNGYTSVIFEDISDYGDPSDVKVFFNPEQVKSADPVTYDDNGNVIPLSQRFNSRESDIRARSSFDKPADGIARAIYNEKVRTPKTDAKRWSKEYWRVNTAHRLHEAYIDSMAGLKTLQEAILEETGNEIHSYEDAYKAENRMSASNKSQAEIYMRDFFQPLMDEVGKLSVKGATLDDIKMYLIAKHGLERNVIFSQRAAAERGEEWNGAIEDYSGLTDLTGEDKDFQAAAQHLVQDFEAGYDTKPLWDKINAATKESLRINYESGLMSKETYDKVRTMFAYYVPLRGWDRNVAADEYEYLTSNRPMLSPTLKTAKGRKSLADDPIATIGYMAESAIIQGNRNLMKQKFLNFVLNNPTSLATVSEQWYVRSGDEWVPSTPDIPADATADEVDAIVKAHDQQMEALGDDATKIREGLKIGKHTTAREGQEHVIRVKRAGKEYCIYINGNPIAAQAINGLTNPNTDQNAFEDVAQWVKNLMARAFTSQNPAFIFTNLSRDVIWAGTAVAVKEDKAYAAQYSKNVTKILGTLKLPVLLRKFQNGTLDMNNEVERYFAEFIRNGGETGFTQINTVEDYKRDIQRIVKDAKGETSKLKKAWQATWGGVEFLNRSAEDITRFSVYMTSRQMGRDIANSIWDAKEVTVNFNKKGRGTFGASLMNFAYIFFNASIQGLANFGRLMYRHPKKMTLALSTFAAAGMISPMYSIFLSALLGDDDDNYWDLPEWVRRNNIVLYNPFSDRGFFTIPLPHELRPFYGMGELFISVIMGKESVENALGKVARGFADLMPIDVTGNGGNMAINLSPTVFQPAAQLIANTDYFGVPIYRKNDYNELDPNWTKAYKGTNPFLVESAKWLNDVTGGDNVVKGKVDINPATVEHLFESYLGGMGKTFNKTATTLSMLFNKDAREWRNVPVLSSFYQVPDDRTSGSQVNREYFEARDEADKIAHQFSGYKKQLRMGAMEYAEKLDELVKSPIFARYQVVNGYNKAITKLNTALKQTIDPTDREQIETAIMELKAEMLTELEKLDAQTDENTSK